VAPDSELKAFAAAGALSDEDLAVGHRVNRLDLSSSSSSSSPG
jgi:hypothetical protein